MRNIKEIEHDLTKIKNELEKIKTELIEQHSYFEEHEAINGLRFGIAGTNICREKLSL